MQLKSYFFKKTRQLSENFGRIEQSRPNNCNISPSFTINLQITYLGSYD